MRPAGAGGSEPSPSRFDALSEDELEAVVTELQRRLDVCRSRIAETFVLVGTLAASSDAAAPFERLLVNDESCPAWAGEPLVVWRRGSQAWAVHEACPHAGISLAEADIEDFGSRYPTSGPCIACPAHMYVFDAGSGACLTDVNTRAARTYATYTRQAAGGLEVWVSRQPRPVDSGAYERVGLEAGNAIQLELVSIGLKRRFGEDSDEERGGEGGGPFGTEQQCGQPQPPLDLEPTLELPDDEGVRQFHEYVHAHACHVNAID